jgi:hypothetical protein
MSACGTFRTWVVTLTMSVLEGKADGPVARPDFPIWTHLGHAAPEPLTPLQTHSLCRLCVR